MKLTKKLEKEILSVYHCYWDAYLGGDMKTFASLLGDDCHIIGSTEFDVFNNKKDTVKYYKATAEQITGKADIRNRKITMLLYDKNVMVEEFSDFYFLADDEWHFYGHTRLSTLFSKQEDDWKIIYQHGSMPDARTEKGEQIAAAEIAEENKQLKAAIKRRTVELEYKNRELEIEAALEKVRSRSLAVHKTDEFNEVIKVVFERLQELKIPLTSVSINVIIEGSKDTEAYICGSGEYGFTLSHIRLAYFDHPIANDRYDAYKKGLDFFTKTYSAEEKNSFFKYEFEVSDLKNIPADLKKMVMESERYTCSVALTKNSMIVVNDFEGKSLSPDEIDIVKRFAKVFEQAYVRFLDLQKAEAQTREAQIEAALEKVRSRSLAMHQSNELQDVVNIVFERLSELNIQADSASVIVLPSKPDVLEYWLAVPGQQYPTRFHIPRFENTIIAKESITAWRQGKGFAKCYTGKEKNENWTYLFKHSDLKNLPADRKEFLLETKAYNVSLSFTTNTALQILRYNEITFSGSEREIFQRFTNVFEQAYTRFLDLKKAEAQAREAKIEMSLEKVRAQSMAMAKSEDLALVVSTVFNELEKLDVKTLRCGIGIINGTTRSVKAWITTSTNVGHTIELSGDEPLSGHSLLDNIFINWKEQESFSYILEGKDLIEYYKAVGNTDFQEEFAKEVLSNSHVKHFYHCVMFPSGGLFTFSETPFSEDTYRILKRFADAFYHAYKRFEDLQKAEAQARESQIELSLERVRAKTMAMHNSNDVTDTVATLFDEVVKLGIETIRCGIGIMHNAQQMEVWTAKPGEHEKADLIVGHLDTNIHPFLTAAYNSWSNKKESYAYELLGDDLINYFTAINNYPGYPVTYNIASLPKRIMHNEFHFAEGSLYVFSLSELSADTKKIFKRFAGVFGQTYRRYLDLQHAESQRRESQIEAALERVRSRTLAMQKSDELAETSAEIFRQLISLGIEPNRLYISIMKDDEGETEFWITDEEGSKVSAAYTDNLNANTSFKKMYEEWKAGKPSMIIDMQGRELEEYFEHLTSLGVSFKDGLQQKRRIQHLAFFNRGFIGMAAPDDQPEETIHLLERFAAVFNLTFTRFNDLKIAEAHAVKAEEDLVEIKTARKKAEEALSELQVTQNQLIQKEKNGKPW